MQRHLLLATSFFFILSAYVFFTFKRDSAYFPIFPEGFDPLCGCKRVKNETPAENRSLCGPTATDRGRGQKIIAFSFFGSKTNDHFSGIGRNIHLVRLYYPGHVMRLYTRWKQLSSEAQSEICRLFCNETIFDICDVDSIDRYPELRSKHGRLWRFAPMADPLCSEWHSRDLDSLISPREVSAVKEWRESGFTFHVMRDNKMHNVPILAGMFGMKITRNNSRILRKTFEEILKFGGTRQYKQLDQVSLSKFLWPLANKDMVAHDSYLCLAFKNALNRPWPTQRVTGPNFTAPKVMNFVGSTGSILSLKSYGSCPALCRPKDHQDWLMC